jgi:Holliday junction resolvase RusA-like endonuclease
MVWLKGQKRPRFFKSSKAGSYQKAIKVLAKEHLPPYPLTGPLIVDFIFILPRPGRLNRKSDPDGLIPCPARPDRDNLQKGTQDALSDFWIDDGQIFDGRTAKFYAEKGGGARIIVRIRNAQEEVSPPATGAGDAA